MEPAGFERMTLALLFKEPGIAFAALYRAPRQPQFGVDAIARRDDNTNEVASCKCHRLIRKGQLTEWSNEFLDHWDRHWQDQKIKRFILAVAADVHSKERDEEVKAETARFAALGIKYEVWAPDQLQEKLRLHRGIVTQHVGVEHVERICGVLPITTYLATGESIVAEGMSADLAVSFRTLASGALRERVEHLLERFRSGHIAEISAALDELGAGPGWEVLSAPDKARVLRLKAHLRIHVSDDASALVLADEADELALQEEPRLRAFLTYRRQGTAAALTVLGEPVTQDGAHLRAALLLQHGDLPSAMRVLDTHPVDGEDAETLRLRSYAALISEDRREALHFADRALSAAPDRPAMTRAAAVARYAAALSPGLEWKRAIQADPVPLDLVRDDDVSRGYLLQAHELFDSLRRKELPRAERRESQVFALACLCNLRDRLQDASGYLASMLAEDPGWAAAAQWGLARALPMERARLKDGLRQNAGDGPEDAEGRILLAILESEEGDLTEAIRLLMSATCFTTPEALVMKQEWLELFQRRYMPEGELAGRHETDIDALPQLARRAEQDGDWSALEGWLDRVASTRPFPQAIVVPISQTLAAAGRWQALSRHSDALLSLATPEPIRIALHAATQTGQYETACRILSQHRTAFRGGRLPADLARLEAEALAGAGDQSRAIAVATLLAHAEGATSADQVAAALAHLRTGNLRAAAPFVERARRSGQLSQRQAVGLAQALSPVSSEIASSLLREALAEPLEPSLFGGAISTALRLGMDRQIAPLLANLHLLGDEPDTGVVNVSIDDLQTMLKEHNETAERAASMYRAGHIPIHLALASTGGNLALFYQLDEAGADARKSNPLFLRNGCIPDCLDAERDIVSQSLRLDITALLIIDQLGMVDVLEQMGSAIFVPSSLPIALLWLKEDLRPPQPGRFSAMREVLAAASSDRLIALEDNLSGEHTIDRQPGHGDGRFRWVFEAGGGSSKADDLHESHGRSIEHSSESSAALPARLNVRGLANGLLEQGAIDPHRHSILLEQFDPNALQTASRTPLQGDEIVLPGVAAVELAVLGLLEITAAAFDLFIPAADLEELKAWTEQSERRQPVIDRLDRLTDRVAGNLAHGTFRTLPTLFGESKQAGPVKGCLLELVSIGDSKTSLTWIDDRYATGRQLPGGGRIIGTVEMLRRFEAFGLITRSRRWAALNQLRVGDAHFIAPTPEELLYHIELAPISEGKLVETPALATLRMHFAKALQWSINLDTTSIQDGGDRGELPFLAALRRSADAALLAIWASEGQDEEKCRLRSDWVWQAFRVDRLPDIGLPGTKPNSWRKILGLGYAATLANGLQLLTRAKDLPREKRLRAYMRWVEQRALPPWAQFDEEFLAHVVDTLTILLLDVGSGGREGHGLDPREAALLRSILGELVLAIPELFQARLLRNVALRDRAGVSQTEVIEIEGQKFSSSLFWGACAKAIGDGAASVARLDGSGTLSLRRQSGRDDVLGLSGCVSGTFVNPVIGLMSPSKAARLRATRSFLDGLGLSSAEDGAAVARIMGARRRADRIEIAKSLRQASLVTSQSALHIALASGASVPWADFSPPNPSILLRHIGVEPSPMVPLRKRLQSAAAHILNGFGAVEAVLRFASLPVPLPDVLMEALVVLPEADRDLVEAALCGKDATPIQLLHGLRIMRLLVSRGLMRHQRFELAVQQMTSRWSAIAELFTTLLQQFGEELQPNGPLSSGLREDEACAAAWLHADHVTRAVQATTSDLQEMTLRLRGRPVCQQAARTVTRHPGYDDTADTTSRMNVEVLLFYGLGYALGADGPDAHCPVGRDTLHGLRTLMSRQIGDVWVPAPWLLSGREQAADNLGSWFRVRPAWIFGEIAGVDGPAAQASILSTLSELNVPQLGRPLLWAFSGWVAYPYLAQDGQALAAAAACEVDLLALTKEDPEIGAEALVFAARVAQASGNEDALKAFGNELVRYAKAIGETHRRSLKPSDRDILPSLLEAVAVVSSSAEESRGWETFAALAARIAYAWPASVSFLRDAISTLASAAYPERAAALWDVWVELRALR